MNNEMTTGQYFCVSFDPTLVSMSIECFDEETGSQNRIENVSPSEKYGFPVIIPRDGFLWIGMAANYKNSGIKKINSGYVKIDFSAKTRTFEDAQVKCGVSFDCKTIQSVEELRQDSVTLSISVGKVSIGYQLKKASMQLAEKPIITGAGGKNSDLLRDIYADLEILEFYRSYDAENRIADILKNAAKVLESGGDVSAEDVYAAEEKLAEYITADTEILRRYKTSMD